MILANHVRLSRISLRILEQKSAILKKKISIVYVQYIRTMNVVIRKDVGISVPKYGVRDDLMNDRSESNWEPLGDSRL